MTILRADSLMAKKCHVYLFKVHFYLFFALQFIFIFINLCLLGAIAHAEYNLLI